MSGDREWEIDASWEPYHTRELRDRFGGIDGEEIARAAYEEKIERAIESGRIPLRLVRKK